MRQTPTADGPGRRQELLHRRRRLIWSGAVFALVATVAIAGLIAVAFSPDRRAWSDDSRVVQIRGTVVDEVRSGYGSCKGADFDTRVEWSQDGELRSAWTGTCRSGPDVGDEVDVWVRDDGKIELTDPEVTIVFMVIGVLVFFGLGVLVFLSVRTNVRKVDEQLAAPPPAP